MNKPPEKEVVPQTGIRNQKQFTDGMIHTGVGLTLIIAGIASSAFELGELRILVLVSFVLVGFIACGVGLTKIFRACY